MLNWWKSERQLRTVTELYHYLAGDDRCLQMDIETRTVAKLENRGAYEQ